VYLEVGTKRVFAGALEWPGWTRSGRDEEGALEALVAYGPRYRKALGAMGRGFDPPRDSEELELAERVKGNASTDFGVPGTAPAADRRTLAGTALDRQAELLEAAWKAFDRAANRARGKELRKGPRGGGRTLDAIVAHVLEAERAYMSNIGGSVGSAFARDAMSTVRDAFRSALSDRSRGIPAPPSRRRSPLWTPRYAIRRSAWHALDHAWEIEDRATAPGRNP
jgi:hypothetical protein